MVVTSFGARVAISGTNYLWTGAVDGDWNNAGNWNSNGVPVDVRSEDGAPLSINNDDRITFNAFGSNPVPTSNIPELGSAFVNPATCTTPQIDLLNGNLSFTGLDRGVCIAGNWSAMIGDGDTGNGTASLSLSGGIAKGISEFFGTQDRDFTIEADGSLTITDSNSGFIRLGSTDKTDRNVAFLLNGGSLSLPQPLEELDGSYIEFRAAGSTFTSALGGTIFTNIAAVSAEIGDGLTFRSTTGEDPVATDNGDGTYTVAFAATDVLLSNDHIASNAVPGSLVGALSYVTNNQSGLTYTLPVTANGPDSASFQISDTTNLRTAVWMTTNSYAISIAAAKDGTPLVTNDFTITVDAIPSDYHAFVVAAEVGDGIASGGEIVGQLQSMAVNPSAWTYSLVDGRTDLFEITDDTNVVQIAGTDPGSVGTVNHVQIQAGTAEATNYLVVAAEVVRGPRDPTFFRFR
jgi:hypothetical protein